MRATFFLLLGLFSACSGTGPKTTSRVTKLLGGQDVVALVPSAEIAAYRIDGMGWGKGPGKRIHGYPVLSEPVAVDGQSRDELAAVLLDDRTYLWDVAKSCEFLPGVVLRYKADPPVDVLLCFSCDELEVFIGGKKVGREDFDPRRRDLVRVVKRLFPDDAAIQKLVEYRGGR